MVRRWGELPDPGASQGVARGPGRADGGTGCPGAAEPSPLHREMETISPPAVASGENAGLLRLLSRGLNKCFVVLVETRVSGSPG